MASLAEISSFTLPDGVRLFFAREGEGFRDLGRMRGVTLDAGCVFREKLEARGGERVRAGAAVEAREAEIGFTLEGISAEALRLALAGGPVSAEAAGEVAVESEMLRLEGLETAALALPMASVSGVSSADGETEYAEGADWETDTGGNGIRRAATSGIPDGAEVLVSYAWQAPAGEGLDALAAPGAPGRARLMLLPKAGAAFFWEIPAAELRPAGPVSLTGDDWLGLPLRLLLRGGAEGFGRLRRWVSG
jgi:hypothetical protein